MIEFAGEISSYSMEYILKREIRISCISALIVSFLFLIPTIIAIILWDWIFILVVPILILMIFLSAVRPSKKSYGRIFPTRIVIDEDKIISEGKEFYYISPILKVKKVIDMGEFYHIYFFNPYKNSRFVCQKDLLKQGTIDDFEKLFAGKLIKK